MDKIIAIALVLGSSVSPAPVLARATNPSERPAQSDQYVDRARVRDPGDFCGRHQNGFLRDVDNGCR